MYLVIITGTPVILIMFLALGISAAYHAYLLMQGILAIIAAVILIAVSVGAAALMRIKAKQCTSPAKPKAPVLVLFMSLISSLLSLYTTYCFVTDLKAYGTGFWDMIYFVFGIVFTLGAWLYATGYWVGAIIGKDGFDYKSFFHQLLGSAIMIGLYWWANS